MEEVVDRWNRITEQTRLTPVKQITNPRRRMVNARLAQYGLNTVIETINMIPQCGFLWKGYGKNEWVITFNWLFKPENFVKVMEGTYLDKNNPASGSSTIADMVNAW